MFLFLAFSFLACGHGFSASKLRPSSAPLRTGTIVGAGDRLQKALEGLSQEGRYNVVLQGLLKSSAPRDILTTDAWPLLEEMAGEREKLDTETRLALVNTAARLEDAAAMDRTLSLIKKTGAARAGVDKYACEMVSGVQLPPTDPRRRADLLEGNRLPVLPRDDRSSEASAASLAILLAGLSATWPFTAPLLHIGDADGLNWAAVLSVLAAGAIGADTFANDGALGLGSTVTLGFSRLFTRDTTRESRCESASFLVAYLLGLPTFTLAPSAAEALGAMDEQDLSCGDLATAAGANRVLVWLMAPVAAEMAEHQQLLASDPRQASSLLKILKGREGAADAGDDDNDAELRARCALQQADLLLKRYANIADLLSNRMESGSATVGNCVALIEENL